MIKIKFNTITLSKIKDEVNLFLYNRNKINEMKKLNKIIKRLENVEIVVY